MAARKTTNAVVTETAAQIEPKPMHTLRTSTQIGKVVAKAAVASYESSRNFGRAFNIAFEGERKRAAQRSEDDLAALRAEYGL